MRRLLLALAVLLPVSASAQRDRPFAEKGDLALVASIPALNVLNLEPAFGGIGLRYRVADRTVIGASVGLQYDVFDQDRTETSGESSARRLSLALWNENHIGRSRGPVSPFLGAGAVFRVGDQRTEQDNVECDPTAPCPEPPVAFVNARTELSVGVGALIGAEIRLARGVTLGAAYVLGVEVSRFRFEQTPADVREQLTEQNILRFGTGVTDLHVSVYF